MARGRSGVRPPACPPSPPPTLPPRCAPPAVPTPQTTALPGAAAVSPAGPTLTHKEKAKGLNLGNKKSHSLNTARSVSAPARRPWTQGVPAAPNGALQPGRKGDRNGACLGPRGAGSAAADCAGGPGLPTRHLPAGSAGGLGLPPPSAPRPPAHATSHQPARCKRPASARCGPAHTRLSHPPPPTACCSGTEH